jgi:hypothetical protein
MSLDPKKVIASFDSASVLHSSIVHALQQKDFPHLGNPAAYGRSIRVAARMPWPILKEIYSRIGGAEGIDPDDLGQVDFPSIARSFADAYSPGLHSGVLIGSSNGAIAHLAAAMQIPWLPGTVMIPVHRIGEADRPDQAMDFGSEHASKLLEANPDITVHQMHDSAQDELMVARMTYFRPKWTRLPDAYRDFLASRLAPGAPVVLVNDESTWPVTRDGERYVFQSGGRGGLTPEQYQELPHTPQANDTAPEAEWGADPQFVEDVRDWCAANDRQLIEILVDGPQEAAHPVAEVLRDWTRARGGAADHLIVPSFVLGDPWRTIELGDVPFWTFFPVQSALDSLRDHLARSIPYDQVDVLMFQHGANSPGWAAPDEWKRVVGSAGATVRMLALREEAAPHDIGSLGRYGPVLDDEPEADVPFTVLPVMDAMEALARVTSERGRSIVIS